MTYMRALTWKATEMILAKRGLENETNDKRKASKYVCSHKQSVGPLM